jgi:hypothetical protein
MVMMVVDQLRWLRRLMPSPDQLDEMLDDDPVAALLHLAQQRAPVETGYDGDPGADPEVVKQFEIARTAAKKLQQHVMPALTPTEIQALHAFVHLVARPALRVRGGDVGGIPASWKRLSNALAVVKERILPGVGRIDAAGDHVGTGWLAANNLLLTNKHVVGQLCGLDVHTDDTWKAKLADAITRRNARWRQQESEWPTWSVDDVIVRDGPAITRIRAVHPQLDMALLEIDGVDDAESRVLRLSADGPKSDAGHEVYVVGYPAVLANVNVHPALEKLLFAGADQQGAKRVSPGKLIALVAPLPIAESRPDESHDASTLGGSSGSPVIDFDTHRVVALHHSGSYGSANYAVPLWLVKNEPFFTDNGITFG